MSSVLDHIRPRGGEANAQTKPPDRSGLPIDRIVRVSRTGERVVSSEKYQTRRQQIQTIDHILAAKGLTPGELYISEDESGHAWEDQRENLRLAMERIRSDPPQSGGIIVAYFSRFARTAPEAIAAIRELNDRGAVFISAQEGLDSTTDMGRFSLGLMALLAEMEWSKLAAGWRRTVDDVIESGRYISGAVPVGYCMGSDGRLIPNTDAVGPNGETVAELLAELFRLRAEEKWSWTRLADWLTAVGVRPAVADMTERKVEDRPARAERYGPDGWKRWSSSSIQAIIANPVYVGWARAMRKSGDHAINEQAHEPLVTEELWLAAQQSRGGNGGRTGEMSNRCLLKSKAVCESCGHTLLITGRFDKRRGERLPLYYCRGRYSEGDCRARGNIDAAKLDGYVERLFVEYIAGLAKAKRVAKSDHRRITKLNKTVEQAENALTYWLGRTAELIATIGPERYEAELQKLQADLDDAETKLREEELRDYVATGINTGDLLKDWQTMTTLEKRHIIGDVIEKVIVKPAHGKKGRGAPPVETRCEIVWAPAFS